MRKDIRRKHDATLRTDRVCTEHSAVFDATPGGQKTRTALHTYVEDVGDLLGTQKSSIEDRRAATNRCRQCRRALRNAGKAVVRVGKLVNLDEDLMKTMQLPGPASDTDLIAYMRGLLDRVSAHADAFVAEGLPPDLLKNLSDRIAAFESARNDRNAARERFTAAAASIHETQQKADDTIAALEAIAINLPDAQPELVTKLRIAKRIGPRAPEEPKPDATTTPTTAPTGTTGPTAQTPPSAPTNKVA